MSGRLVQSLWVGKRLGTMGRLGVASFLAHGHEFHLYGYDAIEDVPRGAVIKDAGEILPRDQMFAYQSGFGQGSYSAGSNFFRYKLLLERGGWWVDTDVVCLRPFEFDGDSVLASELADPAEGGGTIAASSVMKQPAGSPLMRWAWRVCRMRDRDAVRWGEVGPRLLRESIDALGYSADVRAPGVFSPVPFFEWRTLTEPDRRRAPGADAYAVHLWHQMWRAHDVDPEGSFPDTCLYETLKRRYLSRV